MSLNDRGSRQRHWKRWTAALMKIAAVTWAVSMGVRFVAGYVARGWRRLREKRNFSVDVIAPRYGPALVVSTEDFQDDPYGKILEDSYHTRTFRRVAWLEIVRKVCVRVSFATMAVSFLLWLLSPEDPD